MGREPPTLWTGKVNPAYLNSANDDLRPACGAFEGRVETAAPAIAIRTMIHSQRPMPPGVACVEEAKGRAGGECLDSRRPTRREGRREGCKSRSPLAERGPGCPSWRTERDRIARA